MANLAEYLFAEEEADRAEQARLKALRRRELREVTKKSREAKQCHYCERAGTTRDHIVPRSRIRRYWAGTYPPPSASNLVPCCFRCNQLKANKRSDCNCEICNIAWALYSEYVGDVEIIAVRRIAARQDRNL